MEYREFRAMNTDIVLAAEGDSSLIARGFDEAAGFIEGMEARMTRFSPDSELAQLNRSGGTWFRASEELFDVVHAARDFFDQTRGLFDPTILDALESIGYDKSMDEIRAQGAGESPDSALVVRHDFRQVKFDDSARAIRLAPGMRLDLGGIAKGWIAEHAAERLVPYSNACAVDAGGDLFAIGQPKDEGTWRISLDDPRDPERSLAILRISSGAIATSSVTRRRWQQGNQLQHHLIDPRYGQSAKTDWLSVTVIAPHTTIAEVYAKALLIAGSDSAPTLATERDDISYIAVDGSGKLWGYNNIGRLLDDQIE
jgi:FAD:protein FMN transferase